MNKLSGVHTDQQGHIVLISKHYVRIIVPYKLKKKIYKMVKTMTKCPGDDSPEGIGCIILYKLIVFHTRHVKM